MTAAPPRCAAHPERWWSDDPEDRFYAASQCSACPMSAMCADLGRGEPWGVWAGEVHDNVLELIEPSGHEPSHRCYTAGCAAPECRSAHAAYVAERRALGPVTAAPTLEELGQQTFDWSAA